MTYENQFVYFIKDGIIIIIRECTNDIYEIITIIKNSIKTMYFNFKNSDLRDKILLAARGVVLVMILYISGSRNSSNARHLSYEYRPTTSSAIPVEQVASPNNLDLPSSKLEANTSKSKSVDKLSISSDSDFDFEINDSGLLF